MSKYAGNIITTGADTGYSVYFDGTSDYLSVANNTAFDLPADFTIEMWVNFNAVTSQTMIAKWWTGGQQWVLQFRAAAADSITNQHWRFYAGNGTEAAVDFSEASTTSVTTGVWYHIALTRSGSSYRFFRNGAQIDATYTNATAITATTDPLTIAQFGNLSTGGVNGFLSNVRIVKGTALYTAAFTPPTQLFPVSGTSILTCQSPYIVDNSSNAFSITVAGDSKVSTFVPFTGYVPYNPALGAATPGVWKLSDAIQAAQTRLWNMYDPYFNYTTLLLHGNYTGSVDSSNAAVYQNNTFLDSSSNNFTITRNGGAPGMTQGTFSPFSPTGWGYYQDGASSYVSFGTSADFTFGSGDFTVEAWIYVTSVPATKSFNIFNVGAASAGSYGLYVDSAFKIQSTRYGDTAGAGTTANTINFNTWIHVAAVRSSNSAKVYVNGVLDANATYNMGNVTASAGETGRTWQAGQTSTGFVSNLRVCKGTAVYLNNFTPPASPLTSTSQSASNCVLLTFQSNRFVDTNTAITAKTVTPTGTPSVQAFSPFQTNIAYTPQVQGGSGYFDGTGDYLSIADNTAFNLSSGAWTIEAFVYPTTVASRQVIVGKRVASGGFVISWYLQISATGQVEFTNAAGDYLSAANVVKANSWGHIVASYDGANLSMYYNGTRVYGPSAVTCNDSTANIYIGGSTIDSFYMNGYISSLRIVKGQQLYSGASITIPTGPLTTSGYGSTSQSITGTVSLLTNFTNAGIVDSTAKNVLETVADAKISNAQSKFGGYAMYFDGTGDSLQIPDSNLFPVGTENFTIEFWAYFNATGTLYIAGQSDSTGTLGSQSATIIKTSGEKLQFYCVNGTTQYTCTSTNNLPQTTWTHIACVRSGGTLTQYINGTADGTASISTNAINNSSNRFGVGNLGELSTATPMNGYIADFRITKGVARYTGNFTVQTSQWQNQ